MFGQPDVWRFRSLFSFSAEIYSAYSDEFRPALKIVGSSNHWIWAHGASVDTLKSEQRSCLTFPRLISHHLTWTCLGGWTIAQLVGGWAHAIAMSFSTLRRFGRWTEMACCIPRLLLLGRSRNFRSFLPWKMLLTELTISAPWIFNRRQRGGDGQFAICRNFVDSQTQIILLEVLGSLELVLFRLYSFCTK